MTTVGNDEQKKIKRRSLRRWLKSTSNRTFIVYPVIVIIIELLIHQGEFKPVLWGMPLLPWGYLQYRWSGQYRTRHGGGGPGIDIPPERLVDTGIYAHTRNPMYLGHLIFMAGLAVTFWSVTAVALLVFHMPWFQNRVRQDEVHLIELFGDVYVDYMKRVKRWIPNVL